MVHALCLRLRLSPVSVVVNVVCFRACAQDVFPALACRISKAIYAQIVIADLLSCADQMLTSFAFCFGLLLGVVVKFAMCDLIISRVLLVQFVVC